jgi:UDP-N-acetylglucosamine--N-acetylmuramyl-(pentapeptide) pyrophosphoryl-undecaprenol N-acetylglucosamine transferase
MPSTIPRAPHIVFAGGGTGGHLFPGLAVAGELAKSWPEADITFVGGGKTFERRHVATAGYRYAAVPCRPLPRRPWHAMRFVADNVAGYWAARWLLREWRVSLVVGLGGYASAPMVRAAQNLRLPTVLLEANAVPGRATRWLAPGASLVCAAFPEISPFLKQGVRLRVTGTPIRPEFARDARSSNCRLPLAARSRQKQLLVLGGSGGAERMNETLPRTAYKLGAALRDWRIVHQTGAGQVAATQELYRKLGLEAVVVSFIDNLADVLRETHLAVSRGGGATLAELAATGTPAVVVPYAGATDDHQTENARRLVAAGACRLVAEHDAAARLDHRLIRALAPLVADAGERERMAARMRDLARPRAAEKIAAIVRELTQAPSIRHNRRVDAADGVAGRRRGELCGKASDGR